MRTLLIDNYDSFTYNLFQLLAEVNGDEPFVLRNDDEAGWHRLDRAEFDNIVVSPGPGRPERHRDFGLSRLALALEDVPLLGVCLGHQGLCHVAGAKIEHATEPVHGKLSAIRHDRTGLFGGIPSPFQVIRYHSLIARDLPDVLETTAATVDGLVMAVRHRHRPHWGVQFHPESVASEYGHVLMRNFRDLTAKFIRSQGKPVLPSARRSAPSSATGAPTPGASTSAYRVLVEPIPLVPDAETVFESLFARKRASFWLDSSGVLPGLSRFSILGAASGPLGELVSYDVTSGQVVVQTADGREAARYAETLFDHLERELSVRRVPASGLPCEFELGYVGYFGYELKADCGAVAAHRSALPDGCFVFCDRAVVLDHETGQGWLLALSAHGADGEARAWIDHAQLALRSSTSVCLPDLPDTEQPISPLLHHDQAQYRELIEECQREIGDGESYEICLTTMLSTPLRLDPWHTYKILRRVNPAPYAAYLSFPGFAVLSSSPERFLRIDADGVAESRPIKGTRPRGANPVADEELARDLATAEKDRSENLMIVDLIRNDLGTVSSVGSVRVPKLFDVESYPTVHQLVSTVRSQLRDGVSPVACVRAAFPGGSMTGTPKLRTMEIIDRLEGRARGIYAGSLGFLSLSGAVDLNIVIRTIVVADGVAQLGVGGAIVAQSDPDAEIEEAMLKARALLRVLSIAEQQHSDSAPVSAARG